VAPKEKAIHAAPRAARRPSGGVMDVGAESAPVANVMDASRGPRGLRGARGRGGVVVGRR
jgi:hypothetical protein